MLLTLRTETPTDRDAVHQVNRQAFGRDDEADLVVALRDAGDARLSLVAEEDGQVVGHLLFSRMAIDTPAGALAALALAPVAVLPGHQRRGIGSRLIEAGLRQCRELGERIVIVVGHPEYYPRFGFSARLAEPLAGPFSGPAFMALELHPGALAGVRGTVRYPPAFGLDE